MNVDNNDVKIEICIDPCELYQKYLLLLRKNSIVHGHLDEDLLGELSVAFMQCVNRFKFDIDGFMDAFDYHMRAYENKK